ncbi:hypothetical protein RF11_04642 [Thelohanellus kitauei]|uniref:Uncharacterized protein n=1 Tax=Thelohanellus kitauei TaxID=669202 RepID=A0A0C2NDJ5_THEKT|nr:hypothetical protein RF11_04642 [Thelohanellus kitauei]
MITVLCTILVYCPISATIAPHLINPPTRPPKKITTEFDGYVGDQAVIWKLMIVQHVFGFRIDVPTDNVTRVDVNVEFVYSYFYFFHWVKYAFTIYDVHKRNFQSSMYVGTAYSQRNIKTHDIAVYANIVCLRFKLNTNIMKINGNWMIQYNITDKHFFIPWTQEFIDKVKKLGEKLNYNFKKTTTPSAIKIVPIYKSIFWR